MNAHDRHVVVATDRNFLLPTATTLRSLSTSGTGQVTAWVLTSGVDRNDMNRVEASVDQTNLKVKWVDMTGCDFGDTSRNPLGRASYYRLAIGEVLPAEIDKVLYMDVDMLVADSLSPLWETETRGDHVAWAVRSIHFPSICTYGAMDHWPELGLDPRAPYFNSGLIMVSLSGWRSLDVGRRTLAHLRSPLANGALADQEALNAVLAGKWRELPPRWNVQSPFYEHNRGVQLLYPDDVIDDARSNPAVIHFLSRPKPWHQECTHSERARWRRVANETAFAPIKLQRSDPIQNVKWRVKRAASALVRGR